MVNRIYAPLSKASQQQQHETTPPGAQGRLERSEWLPKVVEEEEPEQLYDTLENVVASMQQPQPPADAPFPTPPATAQPQEGGVANAAPVPSFNKPPAPESLVSSKGRAKYAHLAPSGVNY